MTQYRSQTTGATTMLDDSCYMAVKICFTYANTKNWNQNQLWVMSCEWNNTFLSVWL